MEKMDQNVEVVVWVVAGIGETVEMFVIAEVMMAVSIVIDSRTEDLPFTCQIEMGINDGEDGLTSRE